ncbi:Y-family DNA polymerase [Candidatus Dojkabacteria bacterium]|nr:Y-family DNA polymerase [Candidatus Dojkabacteria bacterium]
MNKVYGLVDCNNFFVSCERVFDPRLRKIPVVVLSSNDGCIIARSSEARALGLKVGEPYFKVRSFLETNGVKALSANFRLYTDMSRRVMSLLEEQVRSVSIYSIDEAFLDLSSMRDKDLNLLARRIKDLIYQCTGIPVSIGIAGSKTLAKLANHLAKKEPLYGGVMDFNMLLDWEKTDVFKRFPVQEVWGIGYRSSKKLNSLGVSTISDFMKMSSSWVRSHMGVTGFRTQQELFNIDCDCSHQDFRKSLVISRSFKYTFNEFSKLSGVIARFVHSAGETLRNEKLEARCLSVYIRTNYHNGNKKQYSNSLSVELPEYTDSSTDLLRGAVTALRKVYKEGYEYKKAGIYLSDIRPKGNQMSLFRSSGYNPSIFAAIDRVNSKWKGVVKLGREVMLNGDISAKDKVSTGYTFDWNGLLTAR